MKMLLRLGIGALFVAGALYLGDQLFPPNLSRYHALSTLVLADDDSPLQIFQTRDDKWRLRADVNAVDSRFIAFLIAREDKRFYSHWGVDWWALSRACWQNISARRITSGASTLTMQTVRLLEPRSRALWAKAIEILRAYQLEQRFSKDQILAMYLTLAPYGGNIEGIEAAAHAYFHKTPQSLSVAEAALLVAIPRSPSKYRPDKYAEAAKQARNRLLLFLQQNGQISVTTCQIAKLAPMPARKQDFKQLASHLALYLEQRAPSPTLFKTYIKHDLQQSLERVARHNLTTLPPRANMAILVVENASRTVRAYVGSGNFFDEERRGQIDYIQAIRSPGSTLKPFIYGLGFGDGFIRPSTLIFDDRTRFGSYRPSNFDDQFHGMVTVREALELSLNVPAVRVLSEIGPQRFLGILKEAGIQPRFANDDTPPSLAIALGGLGMSLEQLVTLYAAVASNGIIKPLRYAKNHSTDTTGATFLPARACEQLYDILTLREEGGVPLPSQIAVKTGTSYGHRDAWALGFNRKHTVGVWIGIPDGAPLGAGTGRTLAVPLLKKVFALLPTHVASDKRPRQNMEASATAAFRLRDASSIQRSSDAMGASATPRMMFPLDGAVVTLPWELSRKSKAVPLTVAGGVRPYAWYVDGKPFAAASWQPTVSWTPSQKGFYVLTVVDANARADSAHIEVQ